MTQEHPAFLRPSRSPVLAFVGAGGKTTALFQLAHAISPKAEPVIVTATTHLHIKQLTNARAHWIAESPDNLAQLEHELRGVILVTGPFEGDRTKGVNPGTLAWLHEFSVSHNLPMLIEADGSRQRPLKAPAEHEPVLPEFVEWVVVVAGMQGLGKALNNDNVHRSEIFAQLSGVRQGDLVGPDAVVRVLSHPEGGLKAIPEKAHKAVLLNQADTPELQTQARVMAEQLLQTYQGVVVTSLKRYSEDGGLPTLVYAVYERVAAIILAAGEATRFGQPKQLLDWQGQPLVQHVTETAFAAGFSPVIVVTGAYAQQVENALGSLPVKIARNMNWQAGLASSVKTGLDALLNASPDSDCGAAVFLLADQPKVTPMVLRALTERHGYDLSPIVCPQVQGQRTNPVLFDRITFPDLMTLKGDKGGREIFTKYPVTMLPWHDENLLEDIDTPEDYQRLLREH